MTSIPFLADTVGWMRDKPITVRATAETTAILKEHLFNWKLWPDFAQIPDADNPVHRNRERDLAVASKHLCPSMLAEELSKLERPAEIYITHLKPGEIGLTMREVEDCAGRWRPRMLQGSQVFEF